MTRGERVRNHIICRRSGFNFPPHFTHLDELRSVKSHSLLKQVSDRSALPSRTSNCSSGVGAAAAACTEEPHIGRSEKPREHWARVTSTPNA